MIDTSQNVKVNILCSKSKVAPLQKRTLAKLELCSAHLLADLMNKVKNRVSYAVDEIFYWSDSQIALAWIAHPSANLKTFVTNRVADIQESSEIKNWHHIPGKINPADHISRGLYPKDLVDCKEWFEGSQFFKQFSAEKLPPKDVCDTSANEIISEIKVS